MASNLSPLWDAAPTGQMLVFPKTQGGAGACPGLLDAAPLGMCVKLSNLLPNFGEVFALSTVITTVAQKGIMKATILGVFAA